MKINVNRDAALEIVRLIDQADATTRVGPDLQALRAQMERRLDRTTAIQPLTEQELAAVLSAVDTIPGFHPNQKLLESARAKLQQMLHKAGE